MAKTGRILKLRLRIYVGKSSSPTREIGLRQRGRGDTCLKGEVKIEVQLSGSL